MHTVSESHGSKIQIFNQHSENLSGKLQLSQQTVCVCVIGEVVGCGGRWVSVVSERLYLFMAPIYLGFEARRCNH